MIGKNSQPTSDTEDEPAQNQQANRRSEEMGKYGSDMIKRVEKVTKKGQEEKIEEKQQGVFGKVNGFMKNIRNMGQGVLTNTASFSS